MKTKLTSILALGVACLAPASAHDTWLQTNTAVVRSGDAVYIDFVLGNHGNDHRDFKIAGKPSLADSSIVVVGPDGAPMDLKSQFTDRGYAPKEGFWTARFEPVKPGLYLVVQQSDQVAPYAPERVVRSAKTFFLVSEDLDRVPESAPGYDRELGHPLELVAEGNPVAPMGPGMPITVKLVFRGQPLAGERVSFIPMGGTLAADFDPRFERRTDSSGRAEFAPEEANYYLVVAHHVVPETGPKYDRIMYSATLTVIVPAICPCCGE
ncbi:MAG TPA: DUF4198 domain-containing protein [Nitrospiria bacterium]|nr:DUF4198 domain-containing protein [Nitrospiria bacterium]